MLVQEGEDANAENSEHLCFLGVIPLYVDPNVTGPHMWRVGRMKFVIIFMADVNDGGTFLLRQPPAL